MKKSLCTDEIAIGMLDELKPELTKQASVNLVKAVDYLNTAFEILDNAGLTVQADKILAILTKMGGDNFYNASAKESPFQALLDVGVTYDDIMQFAKGNKLAIAKINKKLRELGFSEKDIQHLLGKGYMSAKESDELMSPERSFTKIDDFIKNPFVVNPSSELKPGDEFEISTIASHKKMRDPRKISDSHTKGLTSEKMIQNLLHHGTEFNMADDGNADDLLNLEISDDDLEVIENENDPEMDFEDEV